MATNEKKNRDYFTSKTHQIGIIKVVLLLFIEGHFDPILAIVWFSGQKPKIMAKNGPKLRKNKKK